MERLLNECEELPQILLMENVPQVHGKKNLDNFNKWIEYLESKGYSNYWKDLNAKDYGVPQNRNRCFMISILGNKEYNFPKPFELELKLKDLLEDEVDEKYYLSDKGLDYVLKREGKYTQLIDENTEVAKSAITAVGNSNWTGNFVKNSCVQVGNLKGGKWDKINESCRRVYSNEGLSPTIHTCQGGNTEPKIIVPSKNSFIEKNTIIL